MRELITDRIDGVTTVDVTSIHTPAGKTFTLQEGGAKHWSNINGTATPATHRMSHNSSATTDYDVGSYGVTFTVAFANDGASLICCLTNEVSVEHTPYFIHTINTTTFRMSAFNKANSANATDKSTVCTALHGVLS